MNELALFAGAGGGLLGSILLGHLTVCAVEIEPYRREVLLRRQRDGMLPMFPIWDDIKTFDGTPWRGVVHLVTGGFPCQPYSVAGKKRGRDDERNLWPDTIRVIREVRPRYALLENVPGLLRFAYFGEILGGLAESGYDAVWDCFPAAAVGAPHLRDRIFILAHARSDEWIGGRREEGDLLHELGTPQGDIEHWHNGEHRFGEVGATVSDTTGERLEGHVDGSAITQKAFRANPWSENGVVRRDWWESEPDVGRVASGVASRVDRLSALGDGQVPAVVVLAWHTLMRRINAS